MFNKRERDFREALKETFNTASGKRVLAHLKLDYVEPSAFSSDSYMMAYLNGRRDIVQQLVNAVREEELLTEEQRIIKITSEEELDNEY